MEPTSNHFIHFYLPTSFSSFSPIRELYFLWHSHSTFSTTLFSPGSEREDRSPLHTAWPTSAVEHWSIIKCRCQQLQCLFSLFFSVQLRQDEYYKADRPSKWAVSRTSWCWKNLLGRAKQEMPQHPKHNLNTPGTTSTPQAQSWAR